MKAGPSCHTEPFPNFPGDCGLVQRSAGSHPSPSLQLPILSLLGLHLDLGDSDPFVGLRRCKELFSGQTDAPVHEQNNPEREKNILFKNEYW